MKTDKIFKFFTKYEAPDHKIQAEVQPIRIEPDQPEPANVAALKKVLRRICNKS